MSPLKGLVDLSRRLGLPERQLVILAEGNTSARDGKTLWVKSSGFSLSDATTHGFCQCESAPLLESLDQDLCDADVQKILLSSVVGEGKKPSVEAFMHAWLLSLPGIEWVGHVHPTAALPVLCHPRGKSLCDKRLFPDEVVCCGRFTAWVPYTDPGFVLAKSIRESVNRLADEHSELPKIIWLQNHGVIAIGRTPLEVESALLMNDKVCRAINAAGGPDAPLNFLSAEAVARIAGRPDEHYRQAMLWEAGVNS